ncbi:MAG: hypothetical protein J6S67_02070 [Methanobrevibacter sp.]|nr:hypothetical protein [Methanobrevibacter sp.]
MNAARSHPNLSREFLGTFKIGQILPIFHDYLVPGDKFEVKSKMFSRFLPLAVPSYVKLNYRTLTLFVPYHQVVDGYESFMANQKLFKGQNNSLPYFNIRSWWELMANNSYGVAELGEVESGNKYDFISYPVSGSATSYTLTAKGRYFYKILQSLGLNMPYAFYYNYSTDVVLTITPLLAFAHAYNCYMSYSPNYNTSALSALLESIKRSPNHQVTAAELNTILSSILLTYEESFVSSCWAQPYFSQNATVPANNSFNDLTENVPSDRNVTYSVGYGSSLNVQNNQIINSAQIRLLLKFDDYFRRSNYAGSKDIEQIYSRLGVKIDDYKNRYPYFLNESFQEVAIGDITSTADTEGAPIGAYAGKAIGSDNASFVFECKDYGMLVTLAWFAPKPTYYLGIDKEYFRRQPFDFYTPELDQGFPSPVNLLQVWSRGNDSIGNTYGYTELYSEYLYARDQIVGDFSRFEDYLPWHFGRDLDSVPLNNLTAQSDTVIYIPQTGGYFERIFNISDPEGVDQDSIMTHIDFSVSTNRPMKDRVGKSGLGDGSLDIPALGSQIN